MVCTYAIRSEFWHAFGQKRIKDVQHIRLLFHKLKLCRLPHHLSFYQMLEYITVSEPYVNISIVILSNVIA